MQLFLPIAFLIGILWPFRFRALLIFTAVAQIAGVFLMMERWEFEWLKVSTFGHFIIIYSILAFNLGLLIALAGLCATAGFGLKKWCRRKL